MIAAEATAPGKIILFGEHAVVYGRPAIAAPVTQVRARATVEDGSQPGVLLRAPDLNRQYWLQDARKNDPFARAVQVTAASAGIDQLPDITVTVSSTIPIASGLGSGAAMAASVIRALATYLGTFDLASNGMVSELTYQVERLLHGTPSGIDNTVVSYERPVFFVRQEPRNIIEMLSVTGPLHFLVADTGIVSKTKDVVGDVRRQWRSAPERMEPLFDGCAQVASDARQAIELGEATRLGRLMDENQDYLVKMTVSSPELEKLVDAALKAGALGAKLSGAGRGGNMISLVKEENITDISEVLLSSGARSVLTTILS